MLKFISVVIGIILFTFQISKSQSLDSVFIDVPCYGFPGITDTTFVNPVAGATNYCWEVFTGSVNQLLINGGLSPQCTSVPSAQVTFVLSSPYYVLCVTAISPGTSSNTSCDTIWGTPIIQFSPANSPVASPSTSGLYGIELFCGLYPGFFSLQWTVTGDIGIDGTGDTTFTTNQNDQNVTLDFGPNFNGGVLCVTGTTPFGSIIPIICMDINTPASVPTFNTYPVTMNHNSTHNELEIEYHKSDNSQYKLSVYDMNGKIWKVQTLNTASGNKAHAISVSELTSGAYVAMLTGNKIKSVLEFVIIK